MQYTSGSEVVVLGLWGLVSAAIGYALRFLIERSHAKEMEALRARYAIELESTKAKLNQGGVRFAKLHEERAQVIKQLYLALVRYQRLFIKLTGDLKFMSSEEVDQALNRVRAHHDQTLVLLADNEIYLAKEQVEMVHTTLKLLLAIGTNYREVHAATKNDRTAHIKNMLPVLDLLSAVEAQALPAIEALEHEFRVMLGVEERAPR